MNSNLATETTPVPARTLVRRILNQAIPILIAQWATVAYGLADTIMVGHTSAINLATMALGTSIYASIFIGMLGFLTALNPIIAQHFGGGRHEDVGKTIMQGVWLAVWLTVIGDIALGFPDFWLSMSHVEGALRDQVAHYLQALAFALPAALLFRTANMLHTAVSRPKVIMMINLFGLCLKVPLSYMFIYGKLGLPALGATGAGVATACVMWTLCLIAALVIHFDHFYARFRIRFAKPDWAHQKELLKLGIPMGFSYFVEVTAFTFMALLVARIGTTAVGAHQIMANLAATCYMVPMTLSIAISTLTAQAIGAGNPDVARRVALVGVRLAIGIAMLFAAGIWLFRVRIVHLYTSDLTVATIALGLIPYLVVFHMCDGVQAVSGYVLRAYKRAVAPMVIYTVTLWGIGLIGGYAIAFHRVFAKPLGIDGVWGASTIALLIAAVTLFTYMLHVTRPAASSITTATDRMKHRSIQNP